MAAVLIAIGVWWNANTVSHLFIHRPFFRRRAANAGVAVLLTAAQGFPQALWRERHLAHHRGAPYRFRLTRELALQVGLLGAVWLAIASAAPAFFVATYLPGIAAGLLMCAVHGHYEHAGGTTSHYGWLYNALCFNDGYHVEHHRHPSAPWWTLPGYREPVARASAWPAPLRWLDLRPPANLRPPRSGSDPGSDLGAWRDGGRGWDGGSALAALERLVLHAPWLQRWMVRVHARALASLLERETPPHDVTIVGGGLFPRTALVLRQVCPDARLTIVDADAAHLSIARTLLADNGIGYVHARFDPCAADPPCDVLVIPLAFDGAREAAYRTPSARMIIVHDWIWNPRGRSRIVSPLLLKRVNLVRR